MALLRRLLLVLGFVVVAWLLVVAFAIVFGGCGGGELGVAPTGPAMKAPECFAKGTTPGVEPGHPGSTVGTCRSPDGAWRLTLKNGVGGWTCALYLTRVSSGRRVRMYRSHNGCSDLTWAEPDLLVSRATSAPSTPLNPATRLVTHPASFTEFVVAPNRRWVAGDAVGGDLEPQITVYALTANNSKCVIVPRGARRTDEVVGFTRNGKSLIVNTAPWNATAENPPGNGVNRQFLLSSLHTDCAGEQLVGQG
jgi:hypothetical protein